VGEKELEQIASMDDDQSALPIISSSLPPQKA
jgi:hypothetical protein